MSTKEVLMSAHNIDDDDQVIQDQFNRIRRHTSIACILWVPPERITPERRSSGILVLQPHVVDYPNLLETPLRSY
jgi:hypothetical protein